MEKQLIIDEKDLKIEFFENKLLINKNGKEMSVEKDYFVKPDVKFNEKGIFVLDIDNSKIDVYDKENLFLKKSIGNKRYWKDQIHEFEYRAFDGIDSQEFFSKPVFFFPSKIFLKNESLFVWDTRNYVVKKISLDDYKMVSAFFLEKDSYDVNFDKNEFHVISNKGKIKIPYDDMLSIKEILKNFSKSKVENRDEDYFINEVLEKKPPLVEYEKIRKDFLIEKIYDLDSEKSEFLTLKNRYQTVRDCRGFSFNENNGDIFLIAGKQSKKEKIYIYKENGNLLSINGEKLLNDTYYSVCLNDKFYSYDLKQRVILQIDSNDNSTKIFNCLKDEGEWLYCLFTDGIDLYTYDYKTNEKMLIDIKEDKVTKKEKAQIPDGYKVQFYIPGKTDFYTLFPQEDKVAYNTSLFFEGNEKQTSIFNIRNAFFIDDDKILLFSYFNSEILIFSIEKGMFLDRSRINSSIKSVYFSKKLSKVIGYSKEDGVVFEYLLDLEKI